MTGATPAGCTASPIVDKELVKLRKLNVVPNDLAGFGPGDESMRAFGPVSRQIMKGRQRHVSTRLRPLSSVRRVFKPRIGSWQLTSIFNLKALTERWLCVASPPQLRFRKGTPMKAKVFLLTLIVASMLGGSCHSVRAEGCCCPPDANHAGDWWDEDGNCE